LVRYDTIEKFNVDSTVDCGQLNVTRNKKVYKKKLKQSNASDNFRGGARGDPDGGATFPDRVAQFYMPR